MRTKACLLLNMVPGLRVNIAADFLRSVSTDDQIFSFGVSDFIEHGINPLSAEKILQIRKSGCLESEYAALQSQEITVITIFDEEYPQLLREISDPPLVLYLKGNPQVLKKKCFAVVGCRLASAYGLSCAEKFSYELGAYGFVIVSGLARGIDTAAHLGSLRTSQTIAVLGCGLHQIYPSENASLAERIIQNGCLISEFPLNTKPLREHFPRRNRIISGLSHGILVVEAAQRSGSLITAHYAAEQGREVFAVPGPITSPQSQGVHQLLKEGAKLVENIEDILAEFGIFDAKVHGESAVLSVQEESVLSILKEREKTIDDIMLESSLSVSDALECLFHLQEKHLVKELPGKWYTKI